MIYKINKKFIIQKFGNKITVYDETSGVMFNLNETASYIINKMLKGWSKSKIINAILKKYKVNKNIAENDYKELTDLLKKNKII